MAKKKYRCRACRCLDNYKLEIQKLRAQKKELLCRNRQLEHQIQELKGLVFKSDNRQKTEEQINQSPKKRGAPFGHKGRTRIKPVQIDEEIEVSVKKCPHCGSEELTRCENHDDHRQEDITIPTVRVTLYRHHYYYCRHCKKTSKEVGKDEIPGSYIGPVAKGIANYLHYKSGLSYGKIEDFFDRFFNLDVKKSSIYGFDNQAKNKGSLIYDEIKNNLKETEYLHVDETGWPNDGKNFWLWCMANKNVTFYHIDKRRNSNVVKENIGKDYSGIILSDFFSTYNKLEDIYRQQKCLVHLLRINKRLRDRFPNSSRVRTFCKKLEKIVKKIIETNKNSGKFDKIQFLELREYLKTQLKSLLSLPLPYPVPDKLRRKLKNRQHELTLCLDLPDIPAHNNFVERQIRPNVILRKITFGTRSLSGMENHQTLMSLIQTADSNNYPVLDLLKGIHSGQNLSLAQLQNYSP
jgi:transposase